jgi:hypothetical protein
MRISIKWNPNQAVTTWILLISINIDTFMRTMALPYSSLLHITKLEGWSSRFIKSQGALIVRFHWKERVILVKVSLQDSREACSITMEKWGWLKLESWWSLLINLMTIRKSKGVSKKPKRWNNHQSNKIKSILKLQRVSKKNPLESILLA